MSQWYAYNSPAKGYDLEFIPVLHSTETQLSKKTVADLTSECDFRGWVAGHLFKADFASIKKNGHNNLSRLRDMEMCQVFMLPHENGSAYAYEWGLRNSALKYMISPVELDWHYA